MRTREEIEAKIAEIEATEGDKGLTPKNMAYLDELLYSLELVDSEAERYGWETEAKSWANGDTVTLRIEGYPPEAPGELEGPDA